MKNPATAGTCVALADDDRPTVFGYAKLSNTQDVGGNARIAAAAAGVGVDALRVASGNVSVNLAAGALNAQFNGLVIH